MGLRISTNVAAMSARRALHNTSENQKTNYTRLASGQRITRAGDDAAGLSIAENMRAQLRSMRQAERNTNDGISLVQVAEGGMHEIGNILVRMRELSIQAATDTVGEAERGFINQEFQSLIQEADRIANVTTFNGTPLLNGQAPQSELHFQVGIRNDEADRIIFNANDHDVQSGAIGIDGLATTTKDDALSSISEIDSALSQVNGIRARLGAMQNRMQSTVKNLQIGQENLAAARSQIADTDVAEVTSHLVRDNILQNAGISVLGQANTAPTSALQLL